MAYLTIRNVPPALADRLDQERQARGRSLNQTVIELLGQALGLGAGRLSNGLASFAGIWTAEEQAAFEQAVDELAQIDEELWR